jgi:hypothetical protein
MRVNTFSGGAPFLSSAQPATTSKPATAVAAKIETQTGTRLFESMKRNPFRETSKDMIHTTGMKRSGPQVVKVKGDRFG